jgi:hypothetical protein
MTDVGAACLTHRQLKQEISKEDGIHGLPLPDSHCDVHCKRLTRAPFLQPAIAGSLVLVGCCLTTKRCHVMRVV